MRTLLCILTLALVGCTTTVTPPPVPAHEASWDGSERNSGVISTDNQGFLVTPAFVSRYKALIKIYGDSTDDITGLPFFTPPLSSDFGLSQENNQWHISPAGMAAMIRMSQWKRAGRQTK